MPLHDKTGPFGPGPGSCRRNVRCCGWFTFLSASHTYANRKHGWLLSLVLPLGTAILRDPLNPSGVLRRMIQGVSKEAVTENVKKQGGKQSIPSWIYVPPDSRLKEYFKMTIFTLNLPCSKIKISGGVHSISFPLAKENV